MPFTLDSVRRRWRTVGALACAGGLAVLAAPASEPVNACGGTPPQPVCSKTVVFGKAAPGVLLLTSGGTFTVPTVTFLGLAGGVPPCPPPPYTATISLTLTCFGGPGGAASVTVPVTPGFNVVPVPITVPAGPPRLCFLSGSSTVAFTDGTTATAFGDQAICIVDPAPDDPSVPRLDLQHLLPGNEIVNVHPGSQAENAYVLTNNDPVETWTGTITVDMRNVAKLPVAGGPNPPGAGVYAVSDTGDGDNFPIAFKEDLDDTGCLPLPPDPMNYTLSEITKTVTLAPGESEIIEVVSRPWGLCANGSCCESTVVVEGLYTDGTDGLACTGAVVAADTSVEPQFLWDDAGRAAQVCPPKPGVPALEILGNPSSDPSDQWLIGAGIPPFQLFFQGQPIPADFFDEGRKLHDEYGRLSSHFFGLDQPLFPVNQPVDFASQLDLFPLQDVHHIEILDAFVMPGPQGFEQTAPLVKIHGGIDRTGDFVVDQFFDVIFQMSIEGDTQFGQQIQPELIELQLQSVGPQIILSGQLVAPSPDPQDAVVRATFHHDIRAFARAAAGVPPCPSDLNGDGLVNAADLLLLLSNWGGPGPVGDIDGNGIVGIPDLLILLKEWGTC